VHYPELTMDDAPRSPFRPAALRRHARAQDAAVLPLIVSPRAFLALWLLTALLLGVATGIWLALTAAAGMMMGG